MFDINEDWVLEDGRVVLSPLKKTVIPEFIDFSIKEPELWEYSLTSAATPEKMKYYIEQAILGRNNGEQYPFIVFDKVKNAVAGSTRFYDIQRDFKTLQLGYTWYGKDFQGTGLNLHCKYLMLAFAFEKMEMERVEFRADNANKRSIAAMKKIGCKEEGILRRNCPKPDGGRRDSIVLSILKEEWFKTVKEMLAKKLA